MKLEDIDDAVLYELTNPMDRSVHLQVDTGTPAGNEHRPLPAGESTDMYGWQMTDQVKSLLRHRRGRPPVLECNEVDQDARDAAAEKAAKEREVDAARKAKLKAELKEQEAAKLEKMQRRSQLIQEHLARQAEAKKPKLAVVKDEPTATEEPTSSTPSSSKKKKSKRRDSVELAPEEVAALENGEELPK